MTRISMIVASITLAVIVLSLVRKGKIGEGHALRWLLGIFGFGALVAVPFILETVANFFDVKDPTNVIFAAGIYVLALLALRQQVEIAKLEAHHRIVVQEMAIAHSVTEPEA